MSDVDFRSSINVQEVLTASDVRLLIRAILERGEELSWSKHIHEELDNDELSTVDAVNVLRCWKYMDPAEQDVRTGDWKYRLHTDLMGVVITFRSVSQLRLITAWRKKK